MLFNVVNRRKYRPKLVAFCTIVVEKPGSNYRDLELNQIFWNRVRVPGSIYKSLVIMLHCVPKNT